ncbi:MAG: leucine-rich repeat domain-containing protein [Paludibacteraceae bacterium]|nr:leucine-rich repeat domain-containing protein [Paludibacteraceae bacterium]
MKTINSFRSKLLALTLALMAGVSTFAYEFEYVNDFHINGFAYKVLPSNTLFPYGSAALIEIADCNKDVVIPEFVSYGNTEYRIITFGIGSVVFTNDASSVVESITIPKTTNIINKNVLAGCPNLKTVVVDSENPYYDSRENCNAIITTSQNPYFTPNTLIAGCKTTIIPNSVAEIGDNAFYNCESLDIITIPNSVTKIGNSAFNACSSLSSIILSENLTAIGDWAFDDCNNLKEVICYALQPPTISQYTFSGISPTIYVPVESIERYRAATGWKEFEIWYISWSSEECHEYKHVKLSVISYGNKLIYSLVTDDGSEILDVDSVWILNTDKEPLQKFYGQSRDTIDLLFLELGTYILEVYLNECVKRKIFFVHPKMKYIWCDTWNVMWFDGWRFDETASTSQYRLGKDTIIGDYTYSKFTSRTSVRFTSDRKVYVYYEGFDDNDPYTQDLLTGEYLAYDFSAQVGDTLEIFSGIHSYTTEQCVVYDVQTDPETNLRTIMLHPLRVVDGDGNVGVSGEEITWLEGVGSPNGFLISTPPPGGGTFALLCAYQGDELKYTGSLYDEYGCEYNATEQNPEDLFPTLWGLQQTICSGYYGEEGDEWASGLTGPSQEITMMDGKPYLQWGSWYLREENDKILVYSEIQKKDLVLYDFTLELGDTLTTLNLVTPEFLEYEGIVGIVDYPLSDYDYTYPIDTLVVTELSKETLLDGKEYTRWKFSDGTVYVEGIGSMSETFFHHIADHLPVPVSYLGSYLVCVSKNNKLLFQMDAAEMERLGAECLCDAENPKELFPTLWGLQRTTFYHYTECSDSYSSLTASNEIVTINDKPYLRFGKMFLREENNQVLIYSAAYDKDLVLYDWNLEVGDSISLLAMDYGVYPEYAVSVVDYRVIVDIDENGDLIMDTIPTDKVVVDKISTITLLDGKEYKTWHLATGWAGGITYVEGIGILSEGYGGGDYLGLIRPEELPTCYYGDLLVCVSKNNKLLYQMDPVKMDELGAECLCDYNRGPRKDNAKDGQIGGRPTPTQWNQLEVVLRQMDNNHTILQAETFSYTLEDISQQVNNKTYFQLARQSTKDTATTKSVVGSLHFGKDEDNRVYFLRDGVEYVLYDFTAEIGDTVEIFAGINNYPQETTYTHVVVDKDTTEDGACRMFLEVVFPDETNTTAENAEKVWLAGLGSLDGIVHNAAKRASNAHAAPSRSASSSETESSVMLCAWREDSCLYTTNHPDYDTFGCVYNQDPTAVEDISTSQSSYQKLLRDGQLFIIHDGKTYNVLGVPVE